MIKMVLALRHELLPKTLHAERRASRSSGRAAGCRCCRRRRAWPRDARGCGGRACRRSASAARTRTWCWRRRRRREAAVGSGRELTGAAIGEEADAEYTAVGLGSRRGGAACAGGAVCRLAVEASGCRLGCCSEHGGVASDALCGACIGVGAGRGGGDGSVACAERGSVARSGVGGSSARTGRRGVRVSWPRQSVGDDGSSTAGGVAGVCARPLTACEAALGRHTDWSLACGASRGRGCGVSLLERVDVIPAGAVLR